MLRKAFPLALAALFGGTPLAAAGPEDRESAPPADDGPREERAAAEPEAPAPAAENPAPAQEADQPAPAGPGGPGAGPARKEAPAEPLAFDRQIERLGNENYRVRAAAQEALLEWGLKRLDEGIEALYAVYRSSEDPEVRWRARQVLRRLVLVKQPFDGPGYLGIQMASDRANDGKGGFLPAVRIVLVREGTAAEAAGLQVGDLITSVDKVGFNDPIPHQAFANYVKAKNVGDEVTLAIRRGEEKLTRKATLRRRSPLLDRLTQWGDFAPLPPQEELDESDFQDWLRTRAVEEAAKARALRQGAPKP